MSWNSNNIGGDHDQDSDEGLDYQNETNYSQSDINYSQSEYYDDSIQDSLTIKVGMLGDAQIGKTTLMVKYVQGKFEPDYIQTLGVNFMEKSISLRSTRVTFSIWDLGGELEFVNMLPIVCDNATALLFMFDLARKSTLNSIRQWYNQARGFNSSAIAILVGTKYDEFINDSDEENIRTVTEHARLIAHAMHAPLVFCSSLHSINIHKIFKIILSKTFDLTLNFDEISQLGAPILEFK
ncbi:Septum-promoting GTP-binding protein 1 [Smittium mucronatum]|uniref:Septum-promoting GTP-binding protein 1 n=1 Tax=Smittium mucronatum TaxID=133383 RepID=A0A1R0GZ52_9FUNG|nr:Septum-promoting GTP-binding protein 1 [Smittium mucronatum]